MITKFFYLALTPTASLPFIYSNVFPITFNDDPDRSRQQTDYETQFRASNGNPANYNAQWSVGYDGSSDADTNRTSEIIALQNAGKTVLTPNWP